MFSDHFAIGTPGTSNHAKYDARSQMSFSASRTFEQVDDNIIMSSNFVFIRGHSALCDDRRLGYAALYILMFISSKLTASQDEQRK